MSGLARRQLTLDNTVAAELAGSEDAVLRALRGHMGDVDFHLRGNVLTLDGDSGDVQTAATVVDELVELIEQGHEVAPGTIEAVTGALDAHESPAEILEDVVWRHRNTKVSPKTLNQKRYVDSIRRHTITFGIGPAGTGKTFLAVAMAAAALAEKEVQRIILTRPAVEAGERLGFLPGDIQAKVDPYLRPLFDALFDMLDPDRVNGYFERGVIEVAPLAFMRGRTLNDSFVILDEAQNTSPEQMKMFLTRLGFNSRMVVTGDITQIDLPDRPALRPRRRQGHPRRGPGHLLRPLRRRGRRPPQARPADSRRLRRPRGSRAGGAVRTRADPEVLTVDLGDVPEDLRGPVAAALAAAGVEDGHLAVEIVGEERIRELNREHRGRDEPTDVLAFPVDGAGPTAGPRELGDVAICPERCTDVTEAAVHGTLHLCGFDHETDDGEMLSLQREILAALPPDAEASERDRRSS